MSKYDKNQTGKTTTSTQIRNMYSDGMSYMNIKFYNTNLSFNLAPFVSRDQTGKTTYDFKNAQMTTVNFEGAYALFDAAKSILDGKVETCELTIPCSGGAYLTLKRSMGADGKYETIFSLAKNNMVVPFKFMTTDQIITDKNGAQTTKQIESGLGAFMKTIEGYLTGINADRHLDKLTEDFAASQQMRQQQQGGGWQQGGQRPQYPNNRNGGQYRKQFQPGQFQPQPPQQPTWQGNPQQNMSSYNLPN